MFDKTGTLTVGRPVVTNVLSFRDDWTPEQVLSEAANSEVHSKHPLAQAVIRSTEERHLVIPTHEECEVILGLGMRVQANGRVLLVGSPGLMRREGVAVDATAQDWVDRLQSAAETPLLLAVDGVLTGLVSLRDEVRPESRGVLEELRRTGVERIVMLTGDNERTAAAVAAELGVTEWRAEVMPEDKQDVVRHCSPRGSRSRSSATARTTPPRSPWPTSASRWGCPAPTSRWRPPTSPSSATTCAGSCSCATSATGRSG